MVGIYQGNTALTPSFPGLTAVYVGATQVWPVGLPEQGFWQPFPQAATDWDRWIYKNENFVAINGDRMQVSMATGASPAYEQTTLVDVSPGVEYTFELEGYQTPAYDIILTAGTTEYGSEIDSVTVDRTTWGGNRHTLVFTPTTDQVYVGFASTGTPPSFGFIYFVNIGCRPQNWVSPGFNYPYPNEDADWDTWDSVGTTTLSASASDLQYRVNAYGTDNGATKAVTVTPGHEYEWVVTGTTGGTYAEHAMDVGTTAGGRDIATMDIDGTAWQNGTWTVLFTPLVDTVWVTIRNNGGYSYNSTRLQGPRCEPTGN